MAKFPPKKVSISPPPDQKDDNNKVIEEKTSKPSLGEMKPIQFKIPANRHQEIKMMATLLNKTMTEMFLEMYEEYKQSRDINL